MLWKFIQLRPLPEDIFLQSQLVGEIPRRQWMCSAHKVGDMVIQRRENSSSILHSETCNWNWVHASA